MNTIKDRAAQINAVAAGMNKAVFANDIANKEIAPRHEVKSNKLVNLEEAIKRSGLKDGMTISFHHHFRGGDKVVNMVVDKLAEMGYKNVHLAASSLRDVHAPVIDHIKNGVITEISTSGMRGELANEIRTACSTSLWFSARMVVVVAPFAVASSTSMWHSLVHRRVTPQATAAVTAHRRTPRAFAARWAMPCPMPDMPTRW